MQGAREYARYFEGEEIVGRLKVVSSSHARGSTFHVYVLPPAEEPEGVAVEVYGITGGNPGWTETYGWLERGPWQDDFLAEVGRRRGIVEEKEELRKLEKDRMDAIEATRRRATLATYPRKG